MPNLHTELSSIIEEAFLKLSASIYFDKQNLHLRHKLGTFVDQHRDWKAYLHILSGQISDPDNFLKKFSKEIKLLFLPKSTKKSDNEFSEQHVSGNFYTNQVYLQPAYIDKVNIFIDAPIEVHIVSVLWLMRYGVLMDQKLTKHCVGNRLQVDKNGEIIHSRTLFHRYEKQYQKWWSDGIQAAKELFEKKEDVTIINFDFKDYYHSIEFDVDLMDDFLKKQQLDIDNDPLHTIFKSIHAVYFDLLIDLKHPALSKDKTIGNYFSLPIGLLSSYVLANWYLRNFDNHIVQEVNPVYYARYVDDLMLVIKNTVIKSFNRNFKDQENISNVTEDEVKYEIANYYIKQHFGKIFERIETLNDKKRHRFQVVLNEYSNIQVQLDKFFIYQFNAQLSPNLLNRFVEEQRERASAFQFLSDDEDDVYKDIDQITFESNFDYSDASKSRFKNLDDNKYKLSVYLAKLIRGSVTGGDDYQPKEITKLKKYFKGYYLIKNYYFWEKLFALFTIRKEYKFVFNLYQDIRKEIKKSSVISEYEVPSEDVKKDLFAYLDYSLEMAIGLYPGMLQEKSLTAEHRNLIKAIPDPVIFRKAGLLRKSAMYYPLLQFTSLIRSNHWALYDKKILEKYLRSDGENLDLDLSFPFPYRIKFYEACLFIMNKSLGKYLTKIDIGFKRYPLNFVDLKSYLEEAFDLFSAMNHLGLFLGGKAVKNNYFKFFEEINLPDKQKLIKNEGKLETIGLEIPNSGSINDKFRVCMINKYVDGKDYEKSLEGQPNSDSVRFEEFNVILDDVKRVKDADIFVMPELALPYEFIYYYVTQTTFSQIGFVSGIEHWTVGNLGFNFLLTSLPIEIFGDKDSVPIFRLKNHYAPVEEEWIQGKRMVVPKPTPYRYELISWRGLYFSTYNCFELADVRHRHLFYGMLDVIFAPVWNPDIHYYNSLIETASRDMHCYIALSNTTQYGDSRVLEPADHISRDKLRVKGGAVKGYRAAILVCDLKIKLLRYFQMHEFKAVKEFNEKYSTSFKPLPPDFPYELAELRYKGTLFTQQTED